MDFCLAANQAVEDAMQKARSALTPVELGRLNHHGNRDEIRAVAKHYGLKSNAPSDKLLAALMELPAFSSGCPAEDGKQPVKAETTKKRGKMASGEKAPKPKRVKVTSVDEKFMGAILQGDLETVKRLATAERVSMYWNGHYPIQYACEHYYFDIVNYLREEHGEPLMQLTELQTRMLVMKNDTAVLEWLASGGQAHAPPSRPGP